MTNGKLLISLGVKNPSFSFGGFGGIIQILNPDSSFEWEFNYADKNHLIHHNVEILLNGNILALIWDLITQDEARQIGYLGMKRKFILNQ